MRVQLDHVLITRFSYRAPWNRGRAQADPLEPSMLARRFRVFQIAALPSVLAQTNQDFSWVLIVDRALPAADRTHLERLVGARARSYLHTFDPAENVRGTDWLAPYRGNPDAEVLVTTNLDDDDALPDRFVAALQSEVQHRAEAGPPVLFAGTRATIEWDLTVSDDAPRGVATVWDRDLNADWRVSSCGFSVACRLPHYPFSILGMRHTYARHHLDFDTPPAHEAITRIRGQLLEAAASAGDDLRAHSVADTFIDMESAAGPVLMTNHLGNLQADRVFEQKHSAPVTGAESFPGVTVDLSVLGREARHFRLGWRQRARRRWVRLRAGIRSASSRG